MAGSMRVAEGEGLRTASLRSASKRMFQRSESIFVTSASTRGSNDDEEDLKWAVIEKLPTYSRLTLSLIQLEQSKSGCYIHDQVDVRNISAQARQELLDRLLNIAEQDNEYFVQKLRERIDKYE